MLNNNKINLITHLILVGSAFSFSINSVSSKNEEIFVVQQDVYDDNVDYGLKSASSFGDEYVENENEFSKENAGESVDSDIFIDFNFALVGDWGCTKNTAKTVDLIQSHDPDIVFSLGDTSYGPDIHCWTDLVSPIADKIKAVIGNHDVMSPRLLDQHLKQFGLDRPYYAFDYNNIHFLMMDSESSYLPGAHPDFSDLEDTEQYRFVENDLAKASEDPVIKWIIVMSHRQLYSSLCGEHESCEPIKKFRDVYHPLFEKYGVDLLFSGHAHNYQRTYPLSYNDVNSSEPIIEVNDKTEYKPPDGMFQIIVGTGGIDFDHFSNQEPYVIYQQDSSYGFLNVDVINKGNVIIGKYYTTDGEILDEFQIRK